MIKAGLGDANHPKKASLRRLFFEAYTTAAADFKRRIGTTGEDAPRRIPAGGRAERRQRLAARLGGFNLDDEVAVSNRLLESAVEMYEDNTLRYIP